MASNLPELLAQDLEASASVFLSKHMTAGAPSPVLTVEDAMRQLSMPGELSKKVFSPHRLPVFVEGHSLGSIGEEDTPMEDKDAEDKAWKRRCVALSSHPLKWDDYSKSVSFEEAEDTDSMYASSATSSSLSAYAEPLTPRARQQSVGTAATSLSTTSESPCYRFPKLSSTHGRRSVERSFLDLDFDSPDQDTKNSDEVATEQIRPHTSSGASSKDWSGLPHHIMVSVPERHSSLSHRVTTFTASEPTHSRRSSLALSAFDHQQNEDQARVSLSSLANCHSRHLSDALTHGIKESLKSETGLIPIISPEYRMRQESEPHSSEPQDHHSLKQEEQEAQAADQPTSQSPPPEPKKMPGFVSVQTWLESDHNQLVTVSSPVQARRGPLPAVLRVPPEVIETLRISVTNFPDTVLLSESLTVELIRHYARRMKGFTSRNGAETGNFDFFDDASSMTPSKRWKLRNMFSSRRSPRSTPSRAHESAVEPETSVSTHHTLSSSPTAVTPAQNWLCIKNIFPLGTDYQCDALYAHIIAYNYMSTLCKPAEPSGIAPSHTSSPTPSGDTTTINGGGGAYADEDNIFPSPPRDGDSTKVPTKAATLLGLSHSSSTTVTASKSRSHGFIKRKPLANTSAKRSVSDRTCTPSMFSAARREDEAAFADLRDGLARCITQLVSTLRLTANPASAPTITVNGQDVDHGAETPARPADMDPVLMRTLCELVRGWEESN